MKRYCLLLFSLLLSLSTLNAQNVDGWDKMKEIYLSMLRYPGANFQPSNGFTVESGAEFEMDISN